MTPSPTNFLEKKPKYMSIETVPENGHTLIAVICENYIIDSEGDQRLCGQPVQLKDFSLWGDEEARRRWDIVDYCPACKEALAKGTCSSPTEEWDRRFAALTPEEQLEKSAEEYDRLIIDRKNQLGLALAYMLQSEAARERDEVARGKRQADGAYLIKQAFVAALMNNEDDDKTWEEKMTRIGGSMLDVLSDPNKAVSAD
jgi:hypothetical protein